MLTSITTVMTSQWRGRSMWSLAALTPFSLLQIHDASARIYNHNLRSTLEYSRCKRTWASLSARTPLQLAKPRHHEFGVHASEQLRLWRRGDGILEMRVRYTSGQQSCSACAQKRTDGSSLVAAGLRLSAIAYEGLAYVLATPVNDYNPTLSWADHMATFTHFITNI